MTAPFLAGQLIDDRFELESVLGSGGFATVYKAIDRQLGRAVAIKLLHDTLLLEEADLARFRRESQVTARLRHKNILTCYNSGLSNGVPYSAMEYIAANTLADELRASTLSWSDLIAIARGIASAMQYAHSEGIVHRDLTPTNVLVDRSNGGCVAKVIDFGLAHVVQLAGVQRLTQEGATVGTALYLSPEQCLARPVDGRSDVYSLGCVLYQCITDSPPFIGSEILDVVAKQVSHAPVAPIEANPNTAKQLSDIVLRCLEKNPEDRFQSMTELDEALSRIVVPQGVITRSISVAPQTRRIRQPSGRPRTAILAFISLALGCAALLFLLPRGSSTNALNAADSLAKRSIVAQTAPESQHFAEQALATLAHGDALANDNQQTLRVAMHVLDAMMQQAHIGENLVPEIVSVARQLPALGEAYVNQISKCGYDCYSDETQAILEQRRADALRAELTREAGIEVTVLEKIVDSLPEGSLDRVPFLIALQPVYYVRNGDSASAKALRNAQVLCESSNEPRAFRYRQIMLAADPPNINSLRKALAITGAQLGFRPAVSRTTMMCKVYGLDSEGQLAALTSSLQAEPQGPDANEIRAALAVEWSHRKESYEEFLARCVAPKANRKQLVDDLLLIAKAAYTHNKIGYAGQAATALILADQEHSEPEADVEAHIIEARVAMKVGQAAKAVALANYATRLIQSTSGLSTKFAESKLRELEEITRR